MPGDAPSPEELREAGVYDPDDPGAAERLELLRYLWSLGITLDEIVANEPGLPRIAYLHLLRDGSERITLAEAASQAGLERDLVARLWRAIGLPDPGDATTLDAEDVEVLRLLAVAMQFVGEEVLLQFARVLGNALARVATALVSSYLVNVGAPTYERDPGGLELAQMNALAIGMMPALAHTMEIVLRRHLEANERPFADVQQATSGYDRQRVTVGFVDLVGSTVLTRTLAPRDLSAVLTSFESLSADVVGSRGGRLVKLIGDEVMFTSPDPTDACLIALDVVDALERDADLPPARAGLAFGDLVGRVGDYFGPVVNLAARAVHHAEPGTVLVPAETATLLDERRVRLVPLGPAELKGFDTPIELVQVLRVPS